MTFDEKRRQIGEWLREPGGDKLWDLLCGLRGPDSPSERGDMGEGERQVAYSGRRKRKYDTVEVIREKAFFGALGGSARHHASTHITLPPEEERDHFDRHMERAAEVLGIIVSTAPTPNKRKGVRVEYG